MINISVEKKVFVILIKLYFLNGMWFVRTTNRTTPKLRGQWKFQVFHVINSTCHIWRPIKGPSYSTYYRLTQEV